MRFNLCTIFAVLFPLPATLSAQAPIVDYHQHLFSPAAAALVSGRPNAPGIAARDLIALLDSAGIQRALVLSVAYTWGKASRAPVASEYEHVKAENDWTAQQVGESARLPQGRVGCVPTPTPERGRVPCHRKQRHAVHA